ncbi:SGNH hydrolase-type esterase domain-containing protein [Pseudomassariella vexata]|uniref:SGNH hydrolase-type esterase domain-containing protein n=1 Tax=Pseudomassariella vexata TaxID=1141098 RepID=A0A1Y2EFU9_9PEZI|nr:SGNH hydrolase-type esterase domain-containing protein [Pseudomassariella vexata]ORY70452.1 SGNH hydrolase-type esterase domain-containing protein [Pseudomassariella vexata]
MYLYHLLTLTLSTLSAVTAIPTAQSAAAAAKPPAFFLAGDSTTAINGGWGNGFLTTLKSPAWGVNIGKSGATTNSFVAGGYWKNVMTHVKDNVDEFDCYVTISFGHNDQKEASGISLAQFQQNLVNFANEVKGLGAKPLLVSSLTRRVFPSGQDHNATDSLHDQRLAAIAAAEQTGSTIVDLNAASLKYVNAIGNTAAQVYNYGDDRKDQTHLNPWGEVVFGRMVADLVVEAVPAVGDSIVRNETMTALINDGKPV